MTAVQGITLMFTGSFRHEMRLFNVNFMILTVVLHHQIRLDYFPLAWSESKQYLPRYSILFSFKDYNFDYYCRLY